MLGSAGAVFGSMLGNALGDRALVIGACLGGIVGSSAAVLAATARGWVAPERRGRVILGAVAGFIVAALIATQTLSSPIGPVLSSLLIGLGAVLANR